MQTATRLTARKAAEETGVSKSTILRALESGKLSGLKEPETGQWFVEPVELFRVFPAASIDADARHGSDDDTLRIGENRNTLGTSEAMHDDASTDTTQRSGASYVERLKAELEALHREVRTQREERERERRQLEGAISDYRHRLDKAEETRNEAVTKLTAVLTDQREQPRRGLFGLLRRTSA